MSLVCRCWFLPLLPMYVKLCLDCWGFYAIVRTWHVTIDCFASFPRDIGANRQEKSCFLLRSLCDETKALTGVQQQPQPAASAADNPLNLSSNYTKCIITKKAVCKNQVRDKEAVQEPRNQNLMNTDQLTEEEGLCGAELCSGLACSPELCDSSVSNIT